MRLDNEDNRVENFDKYRRDLFYRVLMAGLKIYIRSQQVVTVNGKAAFQQLIDTS